MSTSTDPLDRELERRGERRIVTRFIDARLKRLFLAVWHSLPAAAHDAVYAALGEGERVLLVTDHTAANRPGHALGEVVRFGPHINFVLDYFQLDDCSAQFVKYIVAHELAHIVLGHLGASFEERPNIPAMAILAAAPRVDGLRMAAAEVPNEKAADLQAAAWGYPEPRKVTQRKPAQHISIYTTRR